MTTTEAETPAAARVSGTPGLNKALAAVQAEFPSVAKGETADVTGTTKDGRPVKYSYKYADLAACSEVILPLLGKNGLAFSCRPDLIDGKFCLIYELLHESGEAKGGVFPLPSGGKPQELGGLLTYYRRYALCAVTGLAPAGDDDDAQASNTAHQFDTRSAGAMFDQAVPAPPRRQAGPAPAAPPASETQAMRATPENDPWYAGPPQDAPPSDGEWLIEALGKAGAFADEAAGRQLWKDNAAQHRAGKVTTADRKRVEMLIQARIDDLRAKPLEGVVVQEPPAADDPMAAWHDRVADILTTEDADAALADLEVTRKAGTMDGRQHAEVKAAIRARMAGLPVGATA